jgi:hypothetical protein
MGRAQHILAVIVGLIAGVLIIESYGAIVGAARAGGRAIPELWPLGTEALALAMEVSVLEAKRLHHTAVPRLSWVLLVASVALSTLLQVAIAPPSLVGYLTAGATPTWLLGSVAVLSLLYRTPTPADPGVGVEDQESAGESKRELGILRRRLSMKHGSAPPAANTGPDRPSRTSVGAGAGDLRFRSGLQRSLARLAG